MSATQLIFKCVGISPRLVSGDGHSGGSSAVDRLATVDANNQLLLRYGALPLSLPLLQHSEGATRRAALQTIVERCDGLLLQGGTDIEPKRYGETPLQPAWAGDALRDRFEFDLLELFLRADKPVLGICRGFQVLNVVFGGSLYQDIPSQHRDTSVQHDGPRYCGASHAVALHGPLREWYGVERGRVNSAHHQGIKQLGSGLHPQAFADDGICEAFVSSQHRFVHAVQWHPEFHDRDRELLSEAPLMQAFMAAL